MMLAPILLSALAPALAEDTAWSQAQLEEVSKEIQKEVEELRGAKFLRPVQVKVSNTAELRKYMLKREAEMSSPTRVHRDECAAKLLGLVAPALDLRALEMEVLEGQVGGFYDPSSDTFFLMDAMKGAVARVILAHELTHALDDQLHDLDAALKTAKEETDAELAIRCVVEGSGTNLMNRWTVAHGKSIPPSELAELANMGADALRKAPPLLWKPLLASYSAGDGFLSRAGGMNLSMKPATPEDVDRAFREPPRSTEQVLHPERYWDPAQRDDPVKVRIDVAAPPTGWTVLGEDTLGELVLALLATPVADRKGLDMSNPMAVLALKFTNEPAKGWGGDRLALLGRGDDRYLQLATVWDTAKDAEEFEKAMLASAPRTFAGPRESSADWLARMTPTHFAVERGTDSAGRAFVLVRAASIASPDDASFAKTSLPWAASAAERAKSAEDGR